MPHPDSKFPDPAFEPVDAGRKSGYEEAGVHFVPGYFLTLRDAMETAFGASDADADADAGVWDWNPSPDDVRNQRQKYQESNSCTIRSSGALLALLAASKGNIGQARSVPSKIPRCQF
ncbi:hypothetical protein [Rhodobacter sp. 24-YEA-8]|uniref:hypothetical protein n=1 Tax=Rhodobacter sp. 24-YEA-8 TaxID=1884310 RepID=UPI00209B2CD1|nr:hypothetical protein [Rhodobacter sp. 24-YEA-8]